VTIISTVAE